MKIKLFEKDEVAVGIETDPEFTPEEVNVKFYSDLGIYNVCFDRDDIVVFRDALTYILENPDA